MYDNDDEIAKYAALLAHIAELQKQADAMRKSVRTKAAHAVLAIMAEHDMNLDDVIPTRSYRVAGPYQRKKGPQPARYRDPATGKTWSGIGRTPRWIADAPDLSAMLIR